MNLRRIEEISLNSWPALQQILLDGWILRFSGGYTKRANSVNALYPGEWSLEKKVGLCEQIYTEKGLPIIFRLTSLNQENALDALLSERGYDLLDPTLVQSVNLETIDPETPIHSENWNGQVEEWMKVFAQLQGSTASMNPIHQRLLETIPSRKILMILKNAGNIVSCGVGVVENEYIGIFDMVTAPAYRNQGFGKKMVSDLLSWGRHNGAKHAYLQVVRENAPALRLYSKFGFQEVYHYWYRIKRF